MNRKYRPRVLFQTNRRVGRASCTYVMVETLKLGVMATAAGVFCYAAYHVISKYSLLYIMFLCYP